MRVGAKINQNEDIQLRSLGTILSEKYFHYGLRWVLPYHLNDQHINKRIHTGVISEQGDTIRNLHAPRYGACK